MQLPLSSEKRRTVKQNKVILMVAGILLMFSTVDMLILISECAVGLFLTIGASYGLYSLIRLWWDNQLNLATYAPVIDWTIPETVTIDRTWLIITYPDFPVTVSDIPGHVIMRSAAWKRILPELSSFPAFKAQDPWDYKSRVQLFKLAIPEIIQKASVHATSIAENQRTSLETAVHQFQITQETIETRIKRQLVRLADNISWMANGTFFERQRVTRLRPILVSSEARLHNHIQELKTKAQLQEQAVNAFLNPILRLEAIQDKVYGELKKLEAILASELFSDALAEIAIIQNLTKLPATCLVLNNIVLRAPNINKQFIQAAHINSLVITPAGIFIIAVKNSGQSKQELLHASYVIGLIFKEVNWNVKVRTIIIAPTEHDNKINAQVVVKTIQQLRGYIALFESTGLDVYQTEKLLHYWTTT